MKAKYFLAIVILITAACKKEITKLTSDVQGTWELVSRDGGWIGHQEYSPGNGNIISFNGNNYSQKIKIADTIYQYSGTFKIYSGKPCDVPTEQTLIKFNDTGDPASFALSEGKLVIGATQCIADGTTSIYKKIQ